MSNRLRIALIVSAVLHIAVLLALLLGLPSFAPPHDELPETMVAMVFQPPAKASTQAAVPASVPAPAKAPAPPAPHVDEPPTPQPIQPPPLPPPPPPSAAVTPPPIAPPPTPSTPAPPPAPQLAVPPPPVQPPPAPPPQPMPAPVIPPPPPAPPAPPPPPTKIEPPLPKPPAVVPAPPAPPAPPSNTTQPNVIKNAAPNSSSVDNTLQKLRQQLAQAQPPKARPNPRSGGQPDSGGNPLSNDTATLTAQQRGAIGDHVRECWTKDAGALDVDKQRVLLTVTTDATGVARSAVVAGGDAGRMSDPRFRAFTERAIRAVMDARCANLPLPPTDLGRVNVLTFRFSP